MDQSQTIDNQLQSLHAETRRESLDQQEQLRRQLTSLKQEQIKELEAWVLNKDIGFVQEGQNAEVKIDTFNFTKYGLIDGKLITVSNDAVPDEQLDLRYLANVAIDKDWMQVDNRKVNLAAGMSVAVEIKTGQRRLIEYFLSPLLRFKQESLGER